MKLLDDPRLQADVIEDTKRYVSCLKKELKKLAAENADLRKMLRDESPFMMLCWEAAK